MIGAERDVRWRLVVDTIKVSDYIPGLRSNVVKNRRSSWVVYKLHTRVRWEEYRICVQVWSLIRLRWLCCIEIVFEIGEAPKMADARSRHCKH